MSQETIEHHVLKKMVAAGSVKQATAVAQGDSWALVFRVGMMEQTLAGTKSHDVRAFRKIETLVKYLQDLGIRHFDMDATQYDRTARTLRRPDRAASLKRTHEAAEYDKWFRAQVQEVLDEIEAGTAKFIPHEEVFKELDAHIEKKYGKRPT